MPKNTEESSDECMKIMKQNGESPAEWKETFGTGSKMEINKNAIKEQRSIQEEFQC
jgi:hypothetical protein